MNKLYSVHDHWTDIAKKNDVDIESIDGVITGIKVNGEDYGGGSSWRTVFEGSVTTEADDPAPIGTIQNVPLTANTIKVTFNGTEYECGKYANGSYGAPFDEDTEQFDFSDYPFGIGVVQAEGNPIDVYTEAAGTYTLKIEEPQSGESSDFSTAQVTLSAKGLTYAPIVSIYSDELHQNVPTFLESFEAVLYKGSQVCDASEIGGKITVSGDAVYDSNEKTIIITGDCTITISHA